MPSHQNVGGLSPTEHINSRWQLQLQEDAMTIQYVYTLSASFGVASLCVYVVDHTIHSSSDLV